MTVVHSTPLDFKRARIARLKRLPFEKGLFSGTGVVESAPIRAREPFDALIGSFNAQVPRGAAVEMDVRVSVGGAWSGWYGLASWKGGSGGRSLGGQENAWGRVDIDTLKLKKKAAAFRYRIRMRSAGAGAPKLLSAAVDYADSRQAPPHAKPFQPGPWVREIKLEPRSQIEDQRRYRRRITNPDAVLCSPTSLAMVLEYWGLRKSTLAVAEMAQDRESGLFGNWPLNIQAAAHYGLSGHVAWLDFEELQNEIAQGRPAAASVTIQKGDLRSEPGRKTPGHLLAVAGFTKAGDIIAYDPFAPTRVRVRRIYPRREFERIWLERKRGLTYVLGPRFPHEMAVGAAIADLRRKPREAARWNPADRDRLSQLPQRQRVRALKAKGDWVKVESLEQKWWNGKAWQGYPGWVRADTLAWPAFMHGQGPADAPMLQILRTAESFLGAPYVWGGLSEKGIDCSGLTYLSYRAAGLNIPRDAADQQRQAAKISRAALRPGDPVFLANPGADAYHVLLYAGGESLIESREKRGVVKTAFQERFGKRLAGVESGQLVNNLPGRKPAKVRIFFGRIRPIP